MPITIGSNQKCVGNYLLSAKSPRHGATYRASRCIAQGIVSVFCILPLKIHLGAKAASCSPQREKRTPLLTVSYSIFRCALFGIVGFMGKDSVSRLSTVWDEAWGFIYALSADEISAVFAAPRHTITALVSCRFKCPCPPRRQRHFHGNADRAYNTLHFASKVVCQGASPFGNPGQQNRLNISHFPGA